MGGQWEAVARRSMREPPPRSCYTRYRPTTFLLPFVRAHAFARVSVSCSGFELVDDPGHVDDFHGKFPFPRRPGCISTPEKPFNFPAARSLARSLADFRPDRSHLLRLTACPEPPCTLSLLFLPRGTTRKLHPKPGRLDQFLLSNLCHILPVVSLHLSP